MLARPDTPGYRVRKFVSRLPVETAVVLALAASLMVAGAVALHQYREGNTPLQRRARHCQFIFV